MRSADFEVERLNPEKVAYWYFRLNGFLQMENFVVHPERRGGQRTDADLLAVRFPYRAERFFDNPLDIMEDDVETLALRSGLIDVVIAEVKTNQPCTLNGPWTAPEKENVHRVLAAIGCLPTKEIPAAAKSIYDRGLYADASLRIRLVAVGRDKNPEIESRYPDVPQIVWGDVADFMWERFIKYLRQKQQVNQWDYTGRALRHLAVKLDKESFRIEILRRMSVRPPHGTLFESGS